MPVAEVHPSAEELSAFTLGTLGDETNASIETHVADCTICQERAAAAPGDSLIELLRCAHALTESAAHEQTELPLAAVDDTAEIATAVAPAKSDHPATSGAVPQELAQQERYRVVRLLEEGGMSSVYEALRLDRGKAYLFRADTFDLMKMNNEAIADLTELIKSTPEEVGPFQARAAAYLAPLLEPAAMGLGTDRNTLVVSIVHPDMPAGKAGVQVGDKIVRVGLIQPTQFDQVVDHVASFRSGAALEMEIERNGVREVLRMVLAARPPAFGDVNPQRGKAQLEAALRDCNRAIEMDPEDPATYRLRAAANDLLDRHDEAIKSATEALRLDPEDPLAYLARGRSYLEQKEDDKVIADVDEALRLEAEGGAPYALRGLAYANKKMEDKAKADLAEAARLDPKLAEMKEAYDRQLAQEKANPPWQMPRFDVKLPEIKYPLLEKPAGEPNQGPSGSGVRIVLIVGAAIFAIALLAGYLKAKAQ